MINEKSHAGRVKGFFIKNSIANINKQTNRVYEEKSIKSARVNPGW